MDCFYSHLGKSEVNNYSLWESGCTVNKGDVVGARYLTSFPRELQGTHVIKATFVNGSVNWESFYC